MGSSQSKTPEEVQQKKESRKIDAQIKIDEGESKQRNNAKLLLLGAGESGKSTILKQTKILHIQGFGSEEKASFRWVVYSNMMEGIKTILEAMPVLGITFQNEEMAAHSQEILTFIQKQSRLSVLEHLPDPISDALLKLWEDEDVKKTLTMSNKYQLDDSVPYFFSHLDRIIKVGYTPNEQDIVRARVVTTGIVEVNFKLNHNKMNINFSMFDVGGQRSERRKWIHCFEGVTAVMFVTSLAEYDQVLVEDNKTNRMVESLDLFKSIVNNKFFNYSSFILFLNKNDLFEEKMSKFSFTNYFPEYKGEKEAEPVREWIKEQFLMRNEVIVDQKRNVKKKIYPHYTNATDTENIKFVFEDVTNIIVEKLLAEEFEYLD